MSKKNHSRQMSRRAGRVDESELKAGRAHSRLRAALDSCKTNVMVADENLNIVYMNRTMQETMKAAEADLRKELAQFDASRLMGANIDLFHKNPAAQRRMLEALHAPFETDIKVGGRNFHLVVTPIRDDKGAGAGYAVEWKDETVEKAIEAEIAEVVKAVAAGDLTRRVAVEGKSGFALNLAESINKLSGAVSDAFAEIKAAASEVSNAAAEIAASTTDLAQRTEEQAASLEEISASMEEISETVKNNAESAERASKSAGTTRVVADRGGQVVAKAVDAMARIEDSSRKISDIIGVIDEIARQTNLLALNAAVEAARAGEAGRGFAVVASEVRSLAQRSSQAAKDIKDLITNSNDQVKDGVDLVNRAGTALSEIVESIKSVASIVSEIASASLEQATGFEQVNKALAQIDEVTQQNSALVEENAATAKTLKHQAKAMDDRVSFFRIDDGGVFSSAPSVAAIRAPRAPAPRTKAPAPARRKPESVKSPPRGTAQRMQAALAAAVNDPNWQEF